MIYLIHFEKYFSHARHYIGFTENETAQKRIDRHKRGDGARLLYHLNKADIDYFVVRTWPDGTRDQERNLKRRKKSKVLCPVCNRLGWKNHGLKK